MSRHAFAVQGDGMRLDQAIPAGVTTISRRRARDLIERGSVSVDGVRVRTCGRIVKAGAAIVVEDGALPAVHGDVDELYRDEDIIVVDKPAGLATEPTRQASLSVADTLRKRGLGTVLTIVVTAVAFAAFHLEPVRFLVLLPTGLILGWVRWRTGSTGAAMVTHGIVNAPGAIALLVGVPDVSP